MGTLLIILSILPGLAICWFIYYKDQHEKESKQQLLIAFLMGVFSTVPALLLEEYGNSLGFPDHIAYTLLSAFILVAAVEEFVKFVFLRFFFFQKDAFNEPLDGIIYAVMISMGFATLENVMYASFGLGTTLLRAFTAVPAHAVFAVMMGYHVGKAKFDTKNRFILLLKGYLLAVLVHGLYDFLLMQKQYEFLLVLAIPMIYAAAYYSMRLIKYHQDTSPFKEQLIVATTTPPLVEAENNALPNALNAEKDQMIDDIIKDMKG